MHTNNIVIRGNISPPSEARYRVILLVLFSLPQNTFPYTPPQNTFTHLTLYRATYREENGGGILGERKKGTEGIGASGIPPFFTVLYILFFFIRHVFFHGEKVF